MPLSTLTPILRRAREERRAGASVLAGRRDEVDTVQDGVRGVRHGDVARDQGSKG